MDIAKNKDFSIYPECDIQAAQDAAIKIKEMRAEMKLQKNNSYEVIEKEKRFFNLIRSIVRNAYLSRH